MYKSTAGIQPNEQAPKHLTADTVGHLLIISKLYVSDNASCPADVLALFEVHLNRTSGKHNSPRLNVRMRLPPEAAFELMPNSSSGALPAE